MLAAEVQLDRTGLEIHSCWAGADLWAFRIQLIAGRGEKTELFPERG